MVGSPAPPDIFAAFPNFRALGGEPTRTGGTVRSGLIYRSEALLEPGEDDANRLAAKSIRLVCDLRGATERRRAPNRWWAAGGTETIDLDLLGALAPEHQPWPKLREAPDAAGARAAMRAVYAGLPAAAAGHIAYLFRRIAEGSLPLLIHCTAGKDRTGFVSAVLLAALDVPYDAIVADYLASRIRKSAEAIAATQALATAHLGFALPADALDVMMGVDESYLAESFAAIMRAHGGVDAYLLAAGLTRSELAALRDRMVA
ncbi:tyrosine-protein phosphatase [Sphingomonas profundi]|uniref:tyrosine-protein phosphatase n=1 Tax=Alterirhizorhabdus profundi TaxID=2681549 RepID=UPI0012E7A997|nr:tyrosine-protein phosphatase [Sphingomonas profundi]